MPIQNCGVIRGQVVQSTPGSAQSPHFIITLADDNNTEYQVDVNVWSRDGSEVLYYANDDFQCPITQTLQSLKLGFTPLASHAGSGALDYLREQLFDITKMTPLPMTGSSQNDLNAFIGTVVASAQTSKASVFAFGQYFNDSTNPVEQKQNETQLPQGIHDIHMNQGNGSPYEEDNGTYQDGGLLIYFSAEQKWMAMFFAFQTQSFQTDDQGNPSGPSWANEHGQE